jgi:hypothetical protein
MEVLKMPRIYLCLFFKMEVMQKIFLGEFIGIFNKKYKKSKELIVGLI